MKFTHLSWKKNKKMELFERSTLQLMSILVRNEEKDKINTLHTLLKHIKRWEKKNLFLSTRGTFIFWSKGQGV